MKVSLSSALRRVLRHADPLPALSLGYLIGLVLSAAVAKAFPALPVPSGSLPFGKALTVLAASELPILGAIVFAGLTELPALSRLPIVYRGLLWGYGSLRVFLTVGRSTFYFRYVLGCGLTLLPFCCLARLAQERAEGRTALRGSGLFDYLCRCLFYWGLILLTLPLRP